MDLRKLEVFNEVMLTGSVSKAGRNLGRTQPAISSQIAGLEEEVGYKLFERRGGRLHPLPEAHFLHAETQEILTRLNSLQRTMREAGTLEAGHLRVASMPVHAEFLIPRLISRFVRDRPDVSVTLVSQSSGLVFERMAKGESNKQIAYELNIAETTVKSHVSAILHRLKVHNRIQAVLCASNIDFGDYLRR